MSSLNLRTAASHLLLVLLATLPTVSHAESKISFRQITRTHPVAIQRGNSATVEVTSNFTLNGAHGGFVHPPGVRMQPIEPNPMPSEWKAPAETDLGQAFRFQVDAPGDQLPGVREYRIATEQSVSSVAHLLVTDYPVLIESGADNSTPQQAQPVSVPAAVCGVVEAFEDVDFYRIAGKAGQELVCQIFAQRVTQSIHCMAIRYPKIHLMDAFLALWGPNGELIGQNDNYLGGDALLHCRLPVTGDYLLEVRDTRYAGDPRYTYCVEISDQPVVYGVFPMAVQQRNRSQPVAADRDSSPSSDLGASVLEVEVITSRPDNARDTPAGRSWVRIPVDKLAEAEAGWHTFRHTADRKSADRESASPVSLFVSPHPQLTANGNHDSLERALDISLPIGVSGRFQTPGQTHYYRFAARKDACYCFDVQSQRRGFAVDSVIAILDSTGSSLATADDGPFTKDAQLYFKAPRDGMFVIAVRDLNGRAGDRFVYQLRAEPSGPDFELHGEYYYGMLAPAGRAIWFARLARLNGFDGPVQLTVEGLPQGVSFTPVTIPSGMSHAALIFTAAKDAPINASLVRVRGRASLPREGGAMLDAVRDGQVTCELRRAGASRFSRSPIQTQLLAVTKPLDVTEVIASPTEISLTPGGTAEIRVRITRSPEYSDQVLLDTAFSFFANLFGEQLPPGVTMSDASETKLTGDRLEGKIILRASDNPVRVERQPIAILARVPITYSIMTNYASNPLYLTVADAKTPLN